MGSYNGRWWDWLAGWGGQGEKERRYKKRGRRLALSLSFPFRYVAREERYFGEFRSMRVSQIGVLFVCRLDGQKGKRQTRAAVRAPFLKL